MTRDSWEVTGGLLAVHKEVLLGNRMAMQRWHGVSWKVPGGFLEGLLGRLVVHNKGVLGS